MPVTIVVSLFLTCIAIQTVFLIRMFVAFNRYQPEESDHETGVSVIVCARNERENLKSLIPNLCQQDHPNFEVIIVDDRSEDESDMLIREFRETYPHLRMVKVEHLPENLNGKKYALTLGIKGAKKGHILLTDADCLPESDQWIRRMTAGFGRKGTEFILGFSMYRAEKGLLNSLIRFETIWTGIHYLGMALSNYPYMGVGRNLAYTRAVFIENKGFRGYGGVTGGDDDLFVNRHVSPENFQVVLGKDAITWSEPKHTWKDFFHQKLRHLSVGRYYKPVTRILLGVLSLSHIFGYIFMGILLFLPDGWIFGVSGVLVRTLWLLFTFKKACQKLEIPFSTGKILPMDLIYAVYYPVMGVSAIFRKKVRWK